jgi:hypothetical protein
MAEPHTNWRGRLRHNLLLLLGGGMAYFVFMMYAAVLFIGPSPNGGIFIRIRTAGAVIIGCVMLAKWQSRFIGRRIRVLSWLLGVGVVLCAEWYYFGVGPHRTAVEKIYGAGGSIGRDQRGHVTSVGLILHPYTGFAGDDYRVLAAFPKMTVLSLYERKVGKPEATHIGRYTQLTSLRISGQEVNDSAIEPLQPLVNLRSLSLFSRNITDESLPFLNAFARLETLSLDRTAISDVGVLQLELPNLKTLNICGTQVGNSGVGMPRVFVPRLMRVRVG